VEVAHEALLREWGHLREWLDESRNDIRMQRMLAGAAVEWAEAGEAPGFLLRDARLDQFAGWAEGSTVSLTHDEGAYLHSSIAAREARDVEEETRRQHELETAQQLAESERDRAEEQSQSAGRLRRRAVFLTGALVVAAVLAIVAIFFAGRAETNADLAATREIVALTEADQRATAQVFAEEQGAVAEEQRGIAVDEAESRATAQAHAEASEREAIAQRATADVEADFRATAEAIAIREKEIAEEQTRLTRSRELALAALDRLEEDPELSILLALEALSVTYTREADDALHRAVSAARVLGRISDHSGLIVDAGYSPDGRWLATAGNDGTVKIRAADSGEVLQTHTYEDSFVPALAFSPDGEHLATVFHEGSTNQWEPGGATVWDVESGQMLWTTRDEDNIFGDIAYSSDGQRLAAVNDANGLPGITIWDAGTGEILLTIAGDREGHIVCCYPVIDFSSDGQLLSTSSSYTNQAVVYDAFSGQTVAIFIHPDADLDVTAVAFHPDGRSLVTKTYVGNVYLWDIESGDLVATGHAGVLSSLLRFSPDGEHLVVLGEEGDNLSMLDAETLDELTTLPGYHSGWSADFSPDGLRLVSPLKREEALLLDLAPVHELPSIDVSDASDGRSVLSPDQSLVATAGDFGQINVRETATRELLWLAQGHDAWSGAIDFSPDGANLASGSDDGTVAVWDTETGELLLKWTAVEDSWVNTLFYSPDGAQIATAGFDGAVKVFNPATGEVILSLTHTTPVWGIAYNGAGELAVGNGASGTIDFWDPNSGEKLRVLNNAPFIRTMVFDPDGEWLAAGGDDNVLIYDLSTGEARLTLESQEAFILGFGVNTEGSHLITGGFDDSVRVWDPDSGELLHSLPIEGYTYKQFFSPDGKHILLAGSGTLRAFTLDLEELTALARSRLTRELTASECTHYRIESCQETN
jgi:WD40 repeat protein